MEKPKPPPSQKDWSAIEKISKFRKDAEFPCPICKEHLGLNKQVCNLMTNWLALNGTGNFELHTCIS
jgi:hypothetical protein